MNRIVNSRKESRDSDKFICKTNDDVNEWMDTFYVDGRNAPFNLHCLWAWQEQERRHGEMIAEIESLKKDAARYRWLRKKNWFDSDIAVVRSPNESVKLGYDCPSNERLDNYIDNEIKESKS